MFGSTLPAYFLIKKLSWLLSLSLSELEITIMTIPIGPFVVMLSQIKELGIRISEMILRFYTYVIPSFKIGGIRSSQSPNQLHACPCIGPNIPFLVFYAKNEVAAKIVRVYMPIFVGNPREDSHIKVKGLLVGKLI